MSEPRTIKKYSNRRLYDAERSAYVTLSDIRDLVLEGVDFIVREERSGDDITREILLQVIAEQENSGQPLLTTDLLRQMIRFYGGAYHSLFTDYLERTVRMFTDQQFTYQEQFGNMFENAGFSAASEIAQKNMELWQEMQQNVFKIYGLDPKNEK